MQSSPGGGKTSLLRLFTPESLTSLYRTRSNEDNRELYNRLNALGVFSPSGPEVLGVLLSCARNYAKLEDLDLSEGRKERYFYTLLNVRLMIAALRATLTLKGLRYPDGLDRLTIANPHDEDLPAAFPVPGGGYAANEWARTVERRVYQAMDSLEKEPQDAEGYDALYAAGLLTPDCILFDGARAASQVVVMLDDVQQLSSRQRKSLFASFAAFKFPITVWVAERLEALQPDEIFPTGTTSGREFHSVVNLELELRGKRFESTLSSIADRRSRLSDEVDIDSFSSCLAHVQESDGDLDPFFRKATELVRDKVLNKVQNNIRYSELVTMAERLDMTPRQAAITWQVVDILVSRDLRNRQGRLIESPISEEEFEEQAEANIRNAAELFVCQLLGIPYYYGMERLSYLSSSNIEQFLSIAGDLFEEILSQYLLGNRLPLSPASSPLGKSLLGERLMPLVVETGRAEESWSAFGLRRCGLLLPFPLTCRAKTRSRSIKFPKIMCRARQPPHGTDLVQPSEQELP